MKFLLRYIAGFVLFVAATCAAHAQNTTNKGTEFWTAYMDHVNGAGDVGKESKMSLYITSDVNTSGTVDIADGSFGTISFSVTANQVTIVDIPSIAFLDNTSGTLSKGLHILSAKPIAVYAHIYATSVSGATLLLPVATLGKDYLSINYTQVSNSVASREGPSYSSFNVIATEDNTTVQITPAAALTSGQPAGTTFTITLAKKGDVFQGLSSSDLTGTHIKSISANGTACKRIAVFSGSSKISIGDCTNYNTSDNLFQQVYPTASWGKHYITVPLAGRFYDVYRIVINDPTTVITLDGAVVAPSIRGYYEFKSGGVTHVISADKPVQVVQYAVSQNNTIGCAMPNSPDLGDPEMIYLNPLEQSLDHVTLYSTSKYEISTSYINVVIPAAGASSFMLDGTPYTAFRPVANNPAYAYAQIHVGSGSAHNISSSQNFNAIAYGFGIDESYGYAAGTNLANLYEYISLTDPADNKAIQTYGCSDLTYNLSVTLPYSTTQITWNFKDGTTPVVQSNPVAVTSVKNGQTLYTYTYAKKVKYAKGDYTVIATVFNAGADECGQNEDIEFDFTVVDPPPIVYSFSSVCLGDATQFTYPPDPNDLGTKTYSWDFGDGSPLGTDQNPTHTYAAPGDYKVVLSVTNNSGCLSVSPPQTVSISKKPVADFAISSPDCASGTITFTDQSTVVPGTTEAAWSWDFGDGQTATVKNPTHTYTATGTYHVTLITTNNKGCSSDATPKDIVIHSSPVADFVAPDVCLADVTAAFKDASTIDDNTESEFSYAWDFGDATNATPANPNTSTFKNPSHKYNAAKQYNVTLTVTSKYGCVAVKTQQFTVNGSIPKAAFKVENPNTLCSASDVIFDDLSTVDFGNITKMIWYFDYNNHPSDGVVLMRSKGEIPADRKFT
ncbi:PKD domain-containing protein [Mucilaginibacter jinjuensis]|uniref:PKD domain-containing protein n=1 Tax=Mucilaginibacter jinjuensis TaxID=1176721 RepID=A0ABY7TFY3_9SPHI|nr:PKD domain-containing protein [Mucilaginibacter jinjuensis]WCT14517.1 PKD domain-containing protein [Mucilaginibacter jinjuensis]